MKAQVRRKRARNLITDKSAQRGAQHKSKTELRLLRQQLHHPLRLHWHEGWIMPRVVRRIAPSSRHLGRLQHLPSGGRGALPHAICNAAAPRTRKCVSFAQSRRSSIVERLALPIPQPVYAHAQSRRLCQALPIRRIELLVADPIRRHRHERLSAALSELNSIALNPEFGFQFYQPAQVGASTLWIAYTSVATQD